LNKFSSINDKYFSFQEKINLCIKNFDREGKLIKDSRNTVKVFRIDDLYINISRKIFDVLMEEYDKLYQQSKIADTLDMSDLYKEKARKLQRIANNCKMVNYKNSLIRECKPLFTVDEL